jgi:uncharacterized protein (DUF952 family)
MSEPKLSDVLEDLERVSEIANFGIDNLSMGEKESIVHPDQRIVLKIPKDNSRKFHYYNSANVLLDAYEQAFLVTALEQYAESKGYHFDFLYHRRTLSNVRHTANLYGDEDKPYTVTPGQPTRLQAALKAFLEVFGDA